MTWTAVVLGGMLGFGASLVVAWFRARRPTLEARVSPFVRSTLAAEIRRRDAAVTPFPTLERILTPVARDVMRVLERWGIEAADVELRLRRAGLAWSAEQFRARQVAWGAVGLAVGLLFAGALVSLRGASAVAGLMLALVMAVCGAVGRDVALTLAVRRRSRRLLQELPTVAELLALAVAAGESAPVALERVATSTSGAVAESLQTALGRVKAGARLTDALRRMAQDSGVPALDRFAEGVTTAVERGTPLAEVLRAQAQDMRAQGHRELMEEGGRREIAMLIPVVFLILPVTVVFAVFPGLVAINLGG
ncbi:type II secretion system F family protein [uncultured Demequina sp.]|uniref:type II secretion system F family protein n=1 Tax=uncultured Demequina sp. TaxID=693499 RepID=UPI0025CEBA01|nr:type II secretion system F family protein [uncultured Demequina sp.]